MQISTTAQNEIRNLIKVESSLLIQDLSYDLSPQTRVNLFNKIGPSAIGDLTNNDLSLPRKLLPLTVADRVRARIAILSAQRVLSLWDEAYIEGKSLGRCVYYEDEDEFADHKEYLIGFQESSIEEYSVINVPRPFIPQHILTMAEFALKGRVGNQEEFLNNVNEVWGLYGNGFSPRESCIKDAAQEALYLSVLWERYLKIPDHDYSVHIQNRDEYIDNHLEAPMGYAMFAYAGIFGKEDAFIDVEKRRKFWLWWLTWAIPMALKLENE